MRCSVFRQTVVFLALNLLRQTGDDDFRLEHVQHRQCTAGDLCIDLFWISVMITSHLTIQVTERQGRAMYLGGTGPNSMHTKLVCNEAVHTAQPNSRILTQMETRTVMIRPWGALVALATSVHQVNSGSSSAIRVKCFLFQKFNIRILEV